jgi:hypothetical protein
MASFILCSIFTLCPVPAFHFCELRDTTPA